MPLPQLHNTWEFTIDNSLVHTLFLDPTLWAEAVVRPYSPAILCTRCMKLDLWHEKFQIHDNTRELEARSRSCDFCSMLWGKCNGVIQGRDQKIYFDRSGSHLRLNEGYPPILTLNEGPSLVQKVKNFEGHLQGGLPQLPQPGGAAHIKLIRQWLTDCDLNHAACGKNQNRSLPTRLIHVGNQDTPELRLIGTKSTDSMSYTALSHPWGDPPHFRTLRSNISRHTTGMEFDSLPRTFRHAVTITRALGLEYLWIDSICIIQGKDGDFKEESTRMEDVFSNAYCVLAASSSTGQDDGFLKQRSQRQSISFQQENKPPVFVSEFIDDFNRDVLESNLNGRGWVLQERALARRTIYFTDTQTYFECGKGVWAETMTKMHNTLASFLGDPNFPTVAMESSRGGKILLHQDLCMRYSRLALTRQTDRPFAISGLEKRLVESFAFTGGFGALHDENNLGILRRSMLWRRASECVSMKKIEFDGAAPPTWSWMTYEGQIEYLDLPFRKMDWASFKHDLQPPWTGSGPKRWYSGNDPPKTSMMTVIVRDLEPSSSLMVQVPRIILDVTDGASSRKPTKCVVLGRLMEPSEGPQDDVRTSLAVLLVSAESSRVDFGVQVYNRVGVAFVPSTLVNTARDGSKGFLT
ncbi:hypothetical protein KVR01_012223 [Diaporthe batatas]|uniref:uncharacterized protein n=1 Tax=Diaporthe batatas TaxID=748121 RepID=UPI001D03BFB7|nr:uncharacterized protein KVR01_012223 [Diaporthe batatas]KAG8157951.1 hypothetical protein KVR01_012223 [Diaporthe batatas]